MKSNFPLLTLLIFMSCKSQITPLYVGTYTDGYSEGIYKLDFNQSTGELNNLQLAVSTQNPSFIAYSRNRRYIYAVNENLGGSVSSFKIKENGHLNFLNKVSSNGENPCHISINKQGNKAVVSNYSSGSASIYSIARDGKLNEASQIFNYNTEEKVSHAHSAQFFRDELYISDLGTNSLYQYKLKGNTYELTLPTVVEMPENPGPRHFTITKNGQYIYVINEYGNSVRSIKRTENGFKQIDYDNTLDENYKGESFCADIHLSRNELYLYGSNRGENSIVVFKRNKLDGSIEKIQTVPVHGNWPRNFTLDPSGKFLLVANKKSQNISVFKINPSTGKLSFLNDVKVPRPVCLLF